MILKQTQPRVELPNIRNDEQNTPFMTHLYQHGWKQGGKIDLFLFFYIASQLVGRGLKAGH